MQSLDKRMNSTLGILTLKYHRIEINDQQVVGNTGLELRRDI